MSLIFLGLIFYVLTQGAQFVGLAYLPAMVVNLVYSFTSVFVALLGISLLAERPTVIQWCGVMLSVSGAVLYFCPVSLLSARIVGLLAVAIGVLANAGSSVLGRHINRRGEIEPLPETQPDYRFRRTSQSRLVLQVIEPARSATYE